MNGIEIEVKVALESARGFQLRLRRAGFRVLHRRVFERNTLFDADPPTLRPNGCILRLREMGPRCLITYKGKAIVTRTKTREEIEFETSDSKAAHMILMRLGYQPKFIYEKYRTEYTDGHGVVTLDETPIGWYSEIEGTEEWIDSTAALLGIDPQQFLTSSYGTLYLQWCERQGIEPGHMQFGPFSSFSRFAFTPR
ncbi:MAG: class IV adenylate cyclase [Bryobacter sp.]|nr:class IV adenylate cyclase [Bryobacter sp. CoA8 C33]